jgi:hypothetical protein
MSAGLTRLLRLFVSSYAPLAVILAIQRSRAILFWHGEALAWLVRSLLLRDLGFSPDEVAERIRRTPRFQGFKKGLKDSMNL